MYLYILDNLLRRGRVIDRYISLIWTERYADFGDFELQIESTPQYRELLAEGTLLAVNTSTRVMSIETTENKDESDGRSILVVKGRSLEAKLMDRVNRSTGLLVGVPSPEKVEWTGTPGDLARQWFMQICRTNSGVTQDRFPYMVTGNLYPPDTNPEPADIVTIEFEIETLYDSIKRCLDPYGLGMRITRNFDNTSLFFNVYSGRDRTSAQEVDPPIIFSPDLENMLSVTEFHSVELEKNVAYVFHKNGTAVVYAQGTDPSVKDFQRRVLLVEAQGVDDELTGTDLTDALYKIGREELTKHKRISAIDGEITQYAQFQYEVDYNLGDLVEVRTDDGVTSRMRVVEQIMVDDAEGERSYPTFTQDLYIDPATWASWDANGVWNDAEGTWADL